MDPTRIRARPSIRTAVAALVAAAAAHAGEAAERDCAPSAVHADVDGRPLTREEKIARLDEALRESLARFDECLTPAAVPADAGPGAEGALGDAAGDGATGRPAAAAEGGGTEASDAAGAVESVAAEGVEGTEAPRRADAVVPGTGRTAGSGGVRSGASAGIPDGASDDIPDDIPEPDNDSVLEAQIRRAAMEETDPGIRARIWNEYRKYKGLPERPLPDDDGGPSDAQQSE